MMLFGAPRHAIDVIDEMIAQPLEGPVQQPGVALMAPSSTSFPEIAAGIRGVAGAAVRSPPGHRPPDDADDVDVLWWQQTPGRRTSRRR